MNSMKVPVDQALLAQARRVLGTSSTRDTLERALSLAIQHETRRQAVEAELSRLASGRYAGLRSQQVTVQPIPPVRHDQPAQRATHSQQIQQDRP